MERFVAWLLLSTASMQPGQVCVLGAFPRAPALSFTAVDRRFPRLLTHRNGNVLPKNVEFDKIANGILLASLTAWLRALC